MFCIYTEIKWQTPSLSVYCFFPLLPFSSHSFFLSLWFVWHPVKAARWEGFFQGFFLHCFGCEALGTGEIRSKGFWEFGAWWEAERLKTMGAESCLFRHERNRWGRSQRPSRGQALPFTSHPPPSPHLSSLKHSTWDGKTAGLSTLPALPSLPA